jgi:hypothetical protein
MVDSLRDLDSRLRGDGMSAEFAALIVVIGAFQLFSGSSIITFR